MPKVKYTSAKGLYQETGTNEIDLGPPDEVKVKADGAPTIQTLFFMYDFSTQGGAASEITLTDVNGSAMSIPRGFVITDGWIEVATAMTSAGSATIIVGTQGTSNDPDGFLAGALAFDDSSVALSAICPLNGALVSSATASATANTGTHVQLKRKKIITTADPVSITIATAALTAGKLYVALRGYQSLVVV